jgi:hypothetical protein
VKARIEGKNLVVELPMKKPRPSASGKTMIVASSRGVRRCAVKVEGEALYLSLNAFFFPRNSAQASDGQSKANRKSAKRGR